MRHRKTFSLAIVLVGLAPFLTSAVQASASTAASDTAPAGVSKLPVSADVAGSRAREDTANDINQLGLSRYSSVYAGDILNPDGSVTVFLGPGSMTSFHSSVGSLQARPDIKALGTAPSVTYERVPQSIGTLNSVSRTVASHFTELKAAGYTLAGWAPDPQKGTVDVTLSAVPRGMSLSEVASYLQRTLSAHIAVTSITAQEPSVADDRQQDSDPFVASDLIAGPSGWCTSGFTVIGTAGYPRAMTAAHCGDGTFTNGGYTINSSGKTVTDGDPMVTFGTTSNYHSPIGSSKTNPGVDIQLLEDPADEYGFAADVWIGTGTNQPTPMAVTAPMTSYPAQNSQLTTDGAYTKTIRYVPVTSAGAGVCSSFSDDGSTIYLCGLIEMSQTSADGVTPTVQAGDSGGPVFCYACSSAGVQPAGIIEGDSSTTAYATFIGVDLAATGATIDVTP